VKALPLRLDDDLHRRAKVAAASEGVSLNAVLTDLLTRYVEQAEEEQSERRKRPEHPEPPASPPQQPEEETPPEPLPAYEFKSDLMRRTHGQG
jgi:hypothetical protein